MSLNREKNEFFFPSKVYRCPCLGQVVDECFDNDLKSFVEIHDQIWEFVLSNHDMSKVFSVKCGEKRKECIFVCEKHLSIIIFGKKKFACTEKPKFNNTTVLYNLNYNTPIGETYCAGCIKYYLRSAKYYFYYKKFLKKCLAIKLSSHSVILNMLMKKT